MPDAVATADWRARRIADWQFALLRFAVTRAATDESAALAIADELDAVGFSNNSGPRFFLRTSVELCRALVSAHVDPSSVSIIKRHLGRIDDLALRRTFVAAADLVETGSGVGVHRRLLKRPTPIRVRGRTTNRVSSESDGL